MNDRRLDSAIGLLKGAAAELAQIHRAKHYGFWRQEAAPRLGDALAQTEPFRDFRDVQICTWDGVRLAAEPHFGEWAIDLLVAEETPEGIIAAFAAEVERNVANYSELSPVFGAQVNARCDLGEGVTLVPEPDDALASLHRSRFQRMLLPARTSMLHQPLTVTPAFERRRNGESPQHSPSITTPEARHRDAVRERVRFACLIASAGPVELPLSVVRPDHGALFVAREGEVAARPFAADPLASYPVQAAAVTRAFELLGKFREVDSLTRAIDRLGRARLAASPVDRALELGMAAEIALMHDHRPANTEITHKIGGRAAWMLGHDPAEREVIFVDMKKLYQARSQAVHSGTLSSKSTVDLDAADRLVTRALAAILERGGFPDWNSLTMGGDGKKSEAGRS